MLPSKPVRKGPSVNVSPVGGHQTAAVPNPARKSAAPFGSVDKSVYKRNSAPISPTSSPVNDKDAGKGTGSARSGGSSNISDWNKRKGGD